MSIMATVLIMLNGGGFVDMFTGQIHRENDYQIHKIIYRIENKDLLDHFMQTN